MPRHLIWFSCGAASACAAKEALSRWPNAEVLYCDTLKYEHPDNIRFLRDVEKWLGCEIKLLRSEKYTDIFDVFDKTGYLVGVGGARCTTELKKKVRKAYQRIDDVHVFGFTVDEENRIEKYEDENPQDHVAWVLRDAGIRKADCYRILQAAGIELPAMYKLGYNNNNCIGCVKGGMGYWNKIRRDFPEAFDRMAKQERKMNVAICKTYEGKKRLRVFLDELDPNAGHDVPLPDIECGVVCVKAQLQETLSRFDDV
jgi:hypothetical protein